MDNFPTRKGPPTGRGNERQMMAETDVAEYRKRYRTNADGSTTTLKTRGGWPQFETQGQNQDVAPPVIKGVLQAFAVPYANLATAAGLSGYTLTGNFYAPPVTSTSDKRWFSDTRALHPGFEMRRMQQLGLLDWFDSRTGPERNPRVVTWNPRMLGGRNTASCSKYVLPNWVDFQSRYRAPGQTLAEFSTPQGSEIRDNTPNVFLDGKALSPALPYVTSAGARGDVVLGLVASDTLDLYAHTTSGWVRVGTANWPTDGARYYAGFYQFPFMNGSCTEAKGIVRYRDFSTTSQTASKDHIITITLPATINLSEVQTMLVTISPASVRTDRKVDALESLKVITGYNQNGTTGVYDSPTYHYNGVWGSEIIDTVAVEYNGDEPVVLRKGTTSVNAEYFAEASVSPGAPYVFSVQDKYDANVALIAAAASANGYSTLTGADLWAVAHLAGSAPEHPQEVIVQMYWSGSVDVLDSTASTPSDQWVTKWFDSGDGSDKGILSAMLNAHRRDRITQFPEFIDPVIELVPIMVHFPEQPAFDAVEVMLWRITTDAGQNQNRTVTTLSEAETHVPTEVLDIEQCDLRHGIIVTVTKTASDPLNGGEAALHFNDYEGESIAWARPRDRFWSLPGGSPVSELPFLMAQTMGSMSWMTVHVSGQHVVYGRPADGTAKHLHYATPSSDVELTPPFSGSRYVAPIFYREKIKETT